MYKNSWSKAYKKYEVFVQIKKIVFFHSLAGNKIFEAHIMPVASLLTKNNRGTNLFVNSKQRFVSGKYQTSHFHFSNTGWKRMKFQKKFLH